MANVLFTRTSDPNSKPVTDGQLIFDTSGNGKMYLDNGTDRLVMGGALTVDATLSKTSTNPVQNKAVAGVMLDTLSDIGNVTSKGFLTDALAVKELNTNVNELNNSFNDSLVATDGQKLYFDSKDGKYGYNTDPNRGADTFVPFRNAEVVYRDYTNSSATIDNDILFTNNTNAPITVTIAMIVSNTSSSYRYTQIAINGEVKNSYNSGNQIIHQALQAGDVLSMNKQANGAAEVFVITDIA